MKLTENRMVDDEIGIELSDALYNVKFEKCEGESNGPYYSNKPSYDNLAVHIINNKNIQNNPRETLDSSIENKINDNTTLTITHAKGKSNDGAKNTFNSNHLNKPFDYQSSVKDCSNLSIPEREKLYAEVFNYDHFLFDR